MVTITTRYEGDLSTTAVHGPSSSTLRTDAPVDNQGKGRFFSPTDLVATALGTCILTTMGIVAKRHGIAMEGATATVEKHMASDPRRIARLPVVVRMPPGIPAGQRTLLENAAHGCPVHRSLHPECDAPIEFHWPA